MSADEPIEFEVRDVPCSLCGTPVPTRVFTRWPRLEAPPRPEHEHRAAPTPQDWREGEQSDNLETRREP